MANVSDRHMIDFAQLDFYPGRSENIDVGSYLLSVATAGGFLASNTSATIPNDVFDVKFKRR